MKVSGVVMRADTAEPLDHARVTLTIGLRPTQATFSDSAGRFDYADDTDCRGETLRCRVETAGFRAQEVTHEIDHEETNLRAIRLEPIREEPGPVDGPGPSLWLILARCLRLAAGWLVRRKRLAIVIGGGLVIVAGAAYLLSPPPSPVGPSPDAQAAFDRGFGYAMRRQYDLAVKAFDEAIGKYPPFANAYANRGVAHLRMGQYPQAEKDLNQARHLSPPNSPLNRMIDYNLAALYSLQKQKTPALEHLEKAIREGFGDCEELRLDRDFGNIRNEPEFKQVIESCKKR